MEVEAGLAIVIGGEQDLSTEHIIIIEGKKTMVIVNEELNLP